MDLGIDYLYQSCRNNGVAVLIQIPQRRLASFLFSSGLDYGVFWIWIHVRIVVRRKIIRQNWILQNHDFQFVYQWCIVLFLAIRNLVLGIVRKHVQYYGHCRYVSSCYVCFVKHLCKTRKSHARFNTRSISGESWFCRRTCSRRFDYFKPRLSSVILG